MNHIRGRPLSLVRFPDGIHGEKFFQKNLPDWVPDWLGDRGDRRRKEDDQLCRRHRGRVTGVVGHNMACIELHQMHCRAAHRDNPDYFVFDIDPPDGTRGM